MTIRKVASLVVLLLSALAMPAAAGVNRWTEGSPQHAQCAPGYIYCSTVTAIALDPIDENVIYATMSSGKYDDPDPHGIWRSSDGGATWTRLALHLANVIDRPVTVRIAPNRTLYVLSQYGFYLSVDGGSTWTQTTVPRDYVSSTDLTIDPKNGRLYLSQGTECFLGCVGGGVYRSDDGGRHWQRIGLDKVSISRIAVDPADYSTVYAVNDGHLLQTKNGGGSWRDVTPAGPVSMVVVDPVTHSTVYATTGTFSNPFSGVFKSTDGAQSWRLVPGEPPAGGTANVIAIDPIHPRNLLATLGYGTVMRSVDGGESWMPFNDGLANFYRSQLVIAPSGTVFHAVLENGYVFHYSLVSPRRRAAGE